MTNERRSTGIGAEVRTMTIEINEDGRLIRKERGFAGMGKKSLKRVGSVPATLKKKFKEFVEKEVTKKYALLHDTFKEGPVGNPIKMFEHDIRNDFKKNFFKIYGLDRFITKRIKVAEDNKAK